MEGNSVRFGAPKGTRDLLPPESVRWLQVTRHAMDLFARTGYQSVTTPIFEHTEVFERGVGATSEVVGKQMYSFLDLGERSLTLRPEGTAPVVRAVLEHHLERGALPIKLAYSGPMFRQERPQKGRYREFWQLGVESIGVATHLVDVEVIETAMRFFSEVGLEVTLLLNSIGHLDGSCRLGYVEKLQAYLTDHLGDLAPEDRERVDTNPLRTFDSKLDKTQEVMAGAPLISEHLCADCRSHHEGVKELLGGVGIAFVESPKLVRGLDYYTRTAFEFVAEGLGSQDAVGGGGRYDGLAEVLGGPSIPGIGFALGLDRIMLALGELEVPSPIDAYVVAAGQDLSSAAFELTTRLRRAGLGAEMDPSGRGMKGQMKDAARSGARYAVIVGEEELRAGRATVRDMGSGDQEMVSFEELEERLSGR